MPQESRAVEEKHCHPNKKKAKKKETGSEVAQQGGLIKDDLLATATYGNLTYQVRSHQERGPTNTKPKPNAACQKGAAHAAPAAK